MVAKAGPILSSGSALCLNVLLTLHGLATTVIAASCTYPFRGEHRVLNGVSPIYYRTHCTPFRGEHRVLIVGTCRNDRSFQYFV